MGFSPRAFSFAAASALAFLALSSVTVPRRRSAAARFAGRARKASSSIARPVRELPMIASSAVKARCG
jgi:hypothetical protein